MPFPKCKISFNKSFGSCQRETSITDPETGNSTTKMVDCNTKLPPAEYFNIENQIKAGVTLNEVNTNILGSADININEVSEGIKTYVKSKSKSKNNEVNNED